MMKPTYEELYGVDLDTYYNVLDQSVDFSKSAKEIIPQIVSAEANMLHQNYIKNYANRNHELNDREEYLASQIQKLKDKKIKHLKRLREWNGKKSKAISASLESIHP